MAVLKILPHTPSQQEDGWGGVVKEQFSELPLIFYLNPAGDATTVSIDISGNATTLGIFILEMNGKIISRILAYAQLFHQWHFKALPYKPMQLTG